MNRLRKHRLRLLKRNPRCAYCGRALTEQGSTLDHRVPLSRGGGSVQRNLSLACFDCNQKKAGRTAEEFTGEPEPAPEPGLTRVAPEYRYPAE